MRVVHVSAPCEQLATLTGRLFVATTQVAALISRWPDTASGVAITAEQAVVEPRIRHTIQIIYLHPEHNLLLMIQSATNYYLTEKLFKSVYAGE